jgi:hypothetical protein
MNRTYPIPNQACHVHSLFHSDTHLKAHPFYKDAKAGSTSAAAEVVFDLGISWLQSLTEKLPSNAIFVAPFAVEMAGDNALPPILSGFLANLCKGQSDVSIVQKNKVYHTGADPMERMSMRAMFDGDVIVEGNYVLVDDVISMGGTLAELSNYIQYNGGKVLSIVSLVNAGRVKEMCPSKKVVNLLSRRFEHEIEDIFGIQPAALTANEANYLSGFRDANEIRNRLIKAREETHVRLRSKGIELTP